MAEPIADLKVTVSADTAQAEAGLRRYSALLDKTAQQAALGKAAAGNGGADRAAAAELAANAKVEAAKLASASRVEAATISANQRAASAQTTAQARTDASRLSAQARVESAQLSSAARVQSAEINADAKVEATQLNTVAKVEAARINAAARVQAAEIRAATQLQKAQMQQDKLNQPQGPGFIGGIKQVAGAAGIAIGAQQILQYGLAAGQAANSLEKVETRVRSLAGSQALYNEAVALAKRNQDLFGGSLEENLAPLGNMVLLAKNAGLEIAKLQNLSQRLAIKDPSMGAEGAQVALSELLSGSGAASTRSLRERYELSKSDLAGLEKAGLSAQQKIELLDQALANLGITNQALTDQAAIQATVYDRLNAKVDNLQVSVGKKLAGAFKDSAIGLTFLADEAAKFLSGDKGQVQDAGSDVGKLVGGNEADQAALGAGLVMIAEWTGLLEKATPATQALTDANAQLASSQDGVKSAAEIAADAVAKQNTELENNAAQGLISEAQSKLLADAQRGLEAEASAAADAILYGGEVGEKAAQRLANASPLVQQLVDAYIRLRKAQLVDTGFQDQRAGERSGGRFGSAEESKRIKDLERAAAANQKLINDAQRRLQETVGGTPTKLANAQNDLKKLLPGTKEYYDKLTEIEELKQQAAKPARGAGGMQGARDRNAVAGKDLQAQIDYWKQRRDVLAKGSKAWLDADSKVKNLEAKQAKAGNKNAKTAADKDLRLDTANAGAAEQLARYREELQRLDKTSDEYAATLRKIEDLELKVADARNKAQLSRVDDQIKRMEEDRALASARRAMNSNETTAEQKQRAKLEIERITLEREGRQIDIAKIDKEAGNQRGGTLTPASQQAIANAVQNGIATDKNMRTGAIAGTPYDEGKIKNGLAKQAGNLSALPVSQGAAYLDRANAAMPPAVPMSAFPVLPAASVVQPTPSVIVNNQVSNFIDGRELLRGIRTEISTQIQNAVEDNLQQSYDQSVRGQPQGVR